MDSKIMTLTSEMLNQVAGLPTEYPFDNIPKEIRRKICMNEEELYLDFLAARHNSDIANTSKEWINEVYEFHQKYPLSQPWRFDLLRIEVLEDSVLLTPEHDENFSLVNLIKKTNGSLRDGFIEQSIPIDLLRHSEKLLNKLLNDGFAEDSEFSGVLLLAIQSVVLSDTDKRNEILVRKALEIAGETPTVGIEFEIFKFHVEICLGRLDNADLILMPILSPSCLKFYPSKSPIETARSFLQEWEVFPDVQKWKLPWWNTRSFEYWGLVHQVLRDRR